MSKMCQVYLICFISFNPLFKLIQYSQKSVQIDLQNPQIRFLIKKILLLKSCFPTLIINLSTFLLIINSTKKLY